jgi:hypothetical protein
MKGLSEIHGIDLVRRIAKESIKKPEVKKRVWSDELQSWGFFSSSPNQKDIFIIMGCANPGDMLIAKQNFPQLFAISDQEIIEKTPSNPYIILELKHFELLGSPAYGLELLSSNPSTICQMIAQQTSLFKIAWDSL